MKTLIIFGFLLVITNATFIRHHRHVVSINNPSQNATNTRLFGTQLAAIMEKLRALMPEGIPSLGLPPIEPYKRDTLNLNINVPDVVKVNGVFDDFVVRGFQSFVVQYIDFKIIVPLRFDVDLLIDTLVINADHYKLFASVLGKSLVDISGEGTAELTLKDFRIVLAAYISIVNEKLVITETTVDVSMKEVQSNLQGMMGGGDSSIILNTILGDLLPNLVESQRSTISNILGRIVTRFANEQLKDMSLQDIINIILGHN